MDNDELQELLHTRAQVNQELEKMRTPVTILFSDIKGSTPYFEKKGDLEGMAMINRHNGILFPVIEAEGGHVVKTIGDAIMARFDDPVAAVKAAAGISGRSRQTARDVPKWIRSAFASACTPDWASSKAATYSGMS